MIRKSSMLLAAAALALGTLVPSLSVAQQNSGYALSGSNGQVVRAGVAGVCVRTGFWTPALATAECDPDLVPKPAAVPVPTAPAAQPAPAPAPAPKPAPVAPAPAKPKPVAEKVTFAADVFFDFDKSIIKPEGRSKLDDLANKIRDINLEVIIGIGHTDSVGSDAYNQRLSMRRAEAVKAYLVSKGIEANRVYTEGKGEKQPIADNKTADGRAKNRRTEIEVIGTRK
jgi:OOP family OmpA-OmpF porin